MEALERLKRRIHAARIPIRDPRKLRAVKVAYFVVPVVAGILLMRSTGAEQRAERVARLPPEQRARLVGELERAEAAAEQQARDGTRTRARNGETRGDGDGDGALSQADHV